VLGGRSKRISSTPQPEWIRRGCLVISFKFISVEIRGEEGCLNGKKR